MAETLDIAALQRSLGVRADGIAGLVTFTALFVRLGAANARAEELAVAASVHFKNYGVLENGLRFAHFLAQLVHESGSFRYMEEIASGAAYEGRRDLGNTAKGDGVRFKGRGPIQLTGRANYRTFGRRIGIDLERHPEIAAIPSIGLHLALEYWDDRGLNALADGNKIKAITQRINGGFNGLADRQAHYRKIASLLV